MARSDDPRADESRTGERGMVTAEIALTLVALVFAMLAGVWTVTVVGAQIRCIDAARDTARALSRGEPVATALRVGRQSAPDGARFQVVARDGRAQVVVTVDARPAWYALAGLGPVRVRGDASVAYEPGVRPDENVRARVARRSTTGRDRSAPRPTAAPGRPEPWAPRAETFGDESWKGLAR